MSKISRQYFKSTPWKAIVGALVTLTVSVIKTPRQKPFRGARVCFWLTVQVYSYHWGWGRGGVKTARASTEAVGHITSTGKKQSMVNIWTQSTLSFL